MRHADGIDEVYRHVFALLMVDSDLVGLGPTMDMPTIHFRVKIAVGPILFYIAQYLPCHVSDPEIKET